MSRIFIVLIVCFFCDTVGAEQLPIYKEDQIIYYNYHIDNEGFNTVRKLYTPEVSKLIFNSPGGESGIAIKFAKWIMNHDLDIEVDRYCLSSCANYIFPAGKIKYLNKKSVVGWHGGAFQFKKTPIDARNIRTVLSFSKNCDFSRLSKDELLIFESKIKSECAFYKYLNINSLITMYGQIEEDRFYTDNVDFWSYSLDAMAFLGINGIVVKGGDWEPVRMIQQKSIKYFELNEVKEGIEQARHNRLLSDLIN